MKKKKDIIKILCSVLLTCKQMEQQNSRHDLIILLEWNLCIESFWMQFLDNPLTPLMS